MGNNWHWADTSKTALDFLNDSAQYRRPGWYRVKFYGEWKCVEWKDPSERRGGWQFGDHMDPQLWEDGDFEKIGSRVVMPDETPGPD